jgi:hypothetical protein
MDHPMNELEAVTVTTKVYTVFKGHLRISLRTLRGFGIDAKQVRCRIVDCYAIKVHGGVVTQRRAWNILDRGRP